MLFNVCSFYLRMRSTGPGGIKTTRRQSVPETPGASRRTKYPYGPPIWSERTPPFGRKWPRSGRNWAAAAASSANTRTASLTSDTHVGQNQEAESETMDYFQEWSWLTERCRKNDDDKEDEEEDDECIRRGEGLFNKAQVSCFCWCLLFKVKEGENNLTDEWCDF